jgi:predicted tellurium resistance membrane protein TerC
MAKFLPMAVMAVVYLFGFVATPVQEWVAANPSVATVLGGLLTMIGLALKSPLGKSPDAKPAAKPAKFEL